MTLHYHGPEYGYVDSSDSAELDAIARETEQRARNRRVSRRIDRDLTWQESNRLYGARAAVDRVAHRAALLRQGRRLVVLGRGTPCPNLWVAR